MNYEVKFALGQNVHVDGDIKGVICELSISPGPVIKYRVEWFNCGNLCSAWFDEFRLT